MKSKYYVIVIYPAEVYYSDDAFRLDRRIEKLNKKHHVGSGLDIRTGQRDNLFSALSYKEASALAKKAKKIKGITEVHVSSME